MRPLQEWDETDLQKLIDDQLQESLQLDYKQSAALAMNDKCRAEIAKDVSAFANSAGGRIIYGIAEKDNLPVYIDEGVDPKKITREWIENIIISRVQPRIPGIVIKPIQLKNGRNAYVVDIPQATTFAPHQSDDRYFKRYNFSSVPMADYEIKDAMRRASASEPYIWFTIHPSKNSDNGDGIELRASISNRSAEPMLYGNMKVFFEQKFFSGSQPKIGNWKVFEGLAEIGTKAERIPVYQYYTNHAIPAQMPIFKEMKFSLFQVDIPVPNVGQYWLGYEIACPGYSFSTAGRFSFDGSNLIPTSEDFIHLVQP